MSQVREFSNAPIKASSSIGTNVVNPNGDKLGDIKEIVIDPRSGKVAYAVVSFGGFLSMGAKLFAIPFSALKYNVTKSEYAQNEYLQNEYVLDVSRERLEAAPGFDPDHWPLMSDESWHRDMHKYYERLPYWE
jgi:sporulation protein YlmC with PRC-barrel domain